MRIFSRFSLAASLIAVASAQELTPRELFFSAPGSPVKVTPKPVAKPTPSPKETVAKVQPPRTPQPQPARVGGADIIQASTSPLAPLGLRYSLLLSRDNAEYREVDTDSSFRSGDRLKLNVESNDGAYLYVVARGSSGNWSVIFPSSEVDHGNNFIAPFRPYTVPNPGRFYFDEQAGEEKLFIVLSRQPESNFEDIIYKINTPQTLPAAPKAAPRKELQLAQLARPIDDQLVGRVRGSLMARDLVFEKVDDSKPLSQRKETAAYVVNKNTAPGAKLVIDLSLKHR